MVAARITHSSATSTEPGNHVGVVTHDLGSAFFVADRIAFLHEGKIRFVGPPDEARAAQDPHLHEFLTAA